MNHFYFSFHPFSHGYAFLAAAQLKGDVSKFVDNIEDVVAQADEVDEKYLQVSFFFLSFFLSLC